MRDAVAAGLLALALAGCLGPPPAGAPGLDYAGRGCTEVGVVLDGDLAAARALVPEGFRVREAREAFPDLPAGRSVVVLALNHCAFRAGAAEAREVEGFAWFYVEPPPALRLPHDASYAYEGVRWRAPGPVTDALRAALPGILDATFAGMPGQGFAPGMAFDVQVRRAGVGELHVEGVAAAPSDVLRHPLGVCCRTFLAGAAGLQRIDYESTDQPFGEAGCEVRTDLPRIRALLGAGQAEGRCLHNAGYDFAAQVRPAEAP